MTSDDDRIAYLSGDGAPALEDLDQAELDELKALLADPALWAEPGPELEDGIVAAIAAEAAARPEADLETVAPSSEPTPVVTPTPAVPPPPTSLAEHRAKRGWLRPGPLVGAVVAAAAVVIALVVVTGDDTEREQLEAALAPTEELPGASGRAVLTRFESGWQVELDATGLPRLDGGDFYQAWLRNDDGVLVTIGTFNEGNDVVLWAGVSPRDFPVLTVTRESADGNQDSSGVRVLAGPVVDD